MTLQFFFLAKCILGLEIRIRVQTFLEKFGLDPLKINKYSQTCMKKRQKLIFSVEILLPFKFLEGFECLFVSCGDMLSVKTQD
jgi:hypothetical protein